MNDIAEVKAETRKDLLFWVLLGPICLLAALSLLIHKSPGHLYYLPVVALSGMALTWTLRLRGFLLALAFLFTVSFAQIVWFGAPDALWFLGVVFALAFSFLVTLLTLDEAEEVAHTWHKEASHYLHHFTHLSTEKETLGKRLLHLQRTNESKESEIKSFEQVQELARLELLSSLSKQEALTRELAESERQKNLLEEQLESADHHVNENEKLIEKLQSENSLNKSLRKEMSDQIDTLSRERELLESTLNRLQAELETKLPIPAPEAYQLDGLVFTEAEFRRLSGQHKQLREQFADKSLVLDQTRKELFLAQEKASSLEKELAELDFKEPPALPELSHAFEELSQKHAQALEEILALEIILERLYSEALNRL